MSDRVARARRRGARARPLRLAEDFVPRLEQVRLGLPRFAPRTEAETMAAIYTWWNILDAEMYDHDAKYKYQTGYLREMQLKRMVQLVRETGARRYCEIGMNGGHSVAAVLQSTPNVSATVFDMMAFNYSWPVAGLLHAQYGRRFKLHPGNSRATVPRWLHANGMGGAKAPGAADKAPSAAASAGAAGGRGHAGHACDLILIDGDHTAGCRSDMVLMSNAASPRARVVVDDIQMPPGKALARLNATGLMRILETFGPYSARERDPRNPCMRMVQPPYEMCIPWGFSVAKYLRAATLSDY